MKIPIEANVLFSMFEYAAYAKRHHKSEIAGWAHYKRDRGIYKLAPLCKQEVSGGAEVENFPNEILRRTNYPIDDMIVQWHSHVDMRVFFSATDTANIADSMKLMPLLISIVVNCKGEYSCRVDVKNVQGIELQSTAVINDVKLIPYFNNKRISNEVKTKLTPKKYSRKDVVYQFERYPIISSAPATNQTKVPGTYNGHAIYQHYSFKTYGYWDVDKAKFQPVFNEDGSLIVEKPAEVKQPDLFTDYEPPKLLLPQKEKSRLWDDKDFIIAKVRIYDFAKKYPAYSFVDETGKVGEELISFIATLTQDVLEIDRISAETADVEGGLALVNQFLKQYEDFITQMMSPV